MPERIKTVGQAAIASSVLVTGCWGKMHPKRRSLLSGTPIALDASQAIRDALLYLRKVNLHLFNTIQQMRTT
jgi:hypothetical protein